MWLTERGVRVVGTDAWSWDAPFSFTREKVKATGDVSLIWEGHRAWPRDRLFPDGETREPGVPAAGWVRRGVLSGKGPPRICRLDPRRGDLQRLTFCVVADSDGDLAPSPFICVKILSLPKPRRKTTATRYTYPSRGLRVIDHDPRKRPQLATSRMAQLLRRQRIPRHPEPQPVHPIRHHHVGDQTGETRSPAEAKNRTTISPTDHKIETSSAAANAPQTPNGPTERCSTSNATPNPSIARNAVPASAARRHPANPGLHQHHKACQADREHGRDPGRCGPQHRTRHHHGRHKNRDHAPLATADRTTAAPRPSRREPAPSPPGPESGTQPHRPPGSAKPPRQPTTQSDARPCSPAAKLAWQPPARTTPVTVERPPRKPPGTSQSPRSPRNCSARSPQRNRRRAASPGRSRPARPRPAGWRPARPKTGPAASASTDASTTISAVDKALNEKRQSQNSHGYDPSACQADPPPFDRTRQRDWIEWRLSKAP